MQTRYTEDQKASAITAVILNCGNIHRTALQLGIADSTLRMWCEQAPHETRAEILRTRDCKREELREKLQGIVEQAVGIVEKKLGDLNARDACVVLGITCDKLLLLNGEATSITQRKDDPESAARLELFRGRYAAAQLLPVQAHQGRALPLADGDPDDTVTE